MINTTFYLPLYKKCGFTLILMVFKILKIQKMFYLLKAQNCQLKLWWRLIKRTFLFN